VDLGHEVVRFDYDLEPIYRNLDPYDPIQKKFIDRNRPLLEEALLAQVRKAAREKPIDLFFSYFYSACASPGVIQEIRRMGIPTVNWYCNGAHQFHLVEEIAPAFDYCLVPEKFRMGDYRRIGARPIYCQEAANPAVYRPYDLPKEYDAVFVGQHYGDRPAFFAYLWRGGVEAHAFGPGWVPKKRPGRGIRKGFRRLIGKEEDPRDLRPDLCHGPLSDGEMIRMYSRSRIVLGFSSCGDTHRDGERILQVRLRDFEVPMSGGFYLVEYIEELEEFYEIGKEIVCYRDREDLREKIRYYLAHESEREAIRRAGLLRARRDHTWHRRFEAAFREMGFPA
jgi:hypothetical protein